MKSKAFLQLSVISGLVAGLVCFLFFYILKISDAMPLGTRRNIGMIFMWIAMTVGASRYWKTVHQTVNFLEIFGFCIIVVLIASAVDGGLVAYYTSSVEPSLIPEFIVELKKLALQDQASIQEQFGDDKASGPIDFQVFLQQIEQISPSSIFWSNFGVLRMLFHFLYAALVGVYLRKTSLSTYY
ncbi:hypothetical protein BWI96_02175 [Siphonobacter sp. SORGH_AS_0500]|uniref:DUF4199 family protein n=1 Tax=Siphonobacter sp. SORGH_AS_0500 TaxID=1864824 RepID=UPI000CB965BE|nr:DUF4199 family protein [Siphonobacter sp. SORGH_AS_0500]PKK37922.1 hypothetical protein BWI96_02175 [Siphonobacter sp. SORGH_AS_0500]